MPSVKAIKTVRELYEMVLQRGESSKNIERKQDWSFLSFILRSKRIYTMDAQRRSGFMICAIKSWMTSRYFRCGGLYCFLLVGGIKDTKDRYLLRCREHIIICTWLGVGWVPFFLNSLEPVQFGNWRLTVISWILILIFNNYTQTWFFI